MDFKIPEFSTEKDLFSWLVENEELVISQKKLKMKEADGFGSGILVVRENIAEKSISTEELLKRDEIVVKAVINTTGVIDSHRDLHIPGLWNKSLQETGHRLLHLKEHGRRFEDVISSGANLKAFVEEVSWKSLGFNYEGKTEALTFLSTIKRERNPYMFEQYAKGFVTEHSVGMYYVKMLTCIDDEDFPTQKENYDKYVAMAKNPETLGGSKYFWAVLEAKAMEGSAVPLGSNSFTPTTSVSAKEETQAEKDVWGKAWESTFGKY